MEGGRGRLRIAVVSAIAFAFLVPLSLIATNDPVHAATPHGPIVVIGDDGFNATNGVTSGSGTPGDPYVIEGLDVVGVTPVIIENTSVSFIFRNCQLTSTADYGLIMTNVSNGMLENITIGGADEAISITGCNHVTVMASSLNLSHEEPYNHTAGMVIDSSQNITVSDSLISSFNNGIELTGTDYCQISGDDINVTTRCLLIKDTGNLSVLNNSLQAGQYGTPVVSQAILHSPMYPPSWPNNLTISGNEVRAGYDLGMSLDCRDSKIENNTIVLQQPGFGIDLLVAMANLVSNNTFINCGLSSEYRVDNATRVVSNTVNGEPLVFLKGVDGVEVTNAGQVIISEASNITVSGLNLSRSGVGVEILGGVDCSVDNITSGENIYGVKIRWSSRIAIENSNLSSDWDGIEVSSSSEVLVDSCSFFNESSTGIDASVSSNLEILGNRIGRSTYLVGIWELSCYGGNVSGNLIECGLNPGMMLSGENVNVSHNIISGTGSSRDISLVNIRFFRVDNNTLEGGAEGIHMDQDSDYNRIENNTVRNASIGIVIPGYTGSPLPTCDWNVITGNTIEGCADKGVSVTDATNNTISLNVVTDCGVGISITGLHTTHNWIYLNDLYDNGDNVYCDPTAADNYWNSSEPMTYLYGGIWRTGYLGNFFDDYSGIDADGDGVGDTPYNFPNAQDNYPLVDDYANFVPELHGGVVVGAFLLLMALLMQFRRRSSSTRASGRTRSR